MTRSQAFRQRKLNYRQALSILTDDQIEDFDDEIQRNVPKIDTGVEQGEQNVRTFLFSFLMLLLLLTFDVFLMFFRPSHTLRFHFLTLRVLQPQHVT